MQKNIHTDTMRGAGIAYKKQRYITHTTLPFDLSAVRTFSWAQKFFIGFLLTVFISGILFSPLLTVQIAAALISILYFVDTVFNLILTLRSLNKSNEIYTSEKEIQQLSNATLPVYTILCPLYKEAHIIPQFIEAIAALDYPKDKLEVLLLLEEDDQQSIEQVSNMHLPYYFRTIVVPDSLPKTKPKACNYGLSFARGEYLVIFDAEDIPDPLQLKKAYLGFKKVPKHVVCLQAKLNYYNARQNLLTRFFTAEYSLWFDLTLTGLQSFNSTIPLGGTSNHFKTQVLKDLQGWDPFNVTEDADLGIRLFKQGFQTAIIDSTTYEEATSKIKNWLRQRSRWIKGYMQTYLVHMRTWDSFLKEKGLFHNFIFQLTVGGKILFLLLNPLMWVITFGYFFAYPLFGPAIQAIYQPPVSYIAVISWVFGNFLFFYYYMLGCAKRNQWDLMKYIFMIPIYWIMMSTASVVALYQLIFKPHYWEKTAHGFHLLDGVAQVPQVARVTRADEQPVVEPAFRPAYQSSVRRIPTYASISRSFSKNVRTENTFIKSAAMPDLKNIFMHGSKYLPLIFLLSFDFIAAKLLLPVEQVRIYFLLSLTCKIVVIIAQGIASLANEFFSSHKKIHDRFYDRIFAVFLFQWAAFIALGIEGSVTFPFLFGNKFSEIIPYTAFFLFACMCYAISYVFSSYHAKKKTYSFTLVSFFILTLQSVVLLLTNGGIKEMVTLLSYLGTVNIMAMLVLHGNPQLLSVIENNLKSVSALFKKSPLKKTGTDKGARILIFNWRDTKHIWAGGAEAYIHEMAKRWVKDGHSVTIFCGNDGHNSSNERTNGIEIIRRGGVFSVYIFAFLYYMLKFRDNYDVIIDCENGIPFFTPLFTRKPIILLVHHVHQEVFRNFLSTPWRQIATFLEGKVMPFVYRNKLLVTVSESSKAEILKLGFTKEENIEVIYNGVSHGTSITIAKTPNPSFVYVGRLKEYKNIDTAIKAFALLLKDFPTAKLSIVGSGEEGATLKRLVQDLKMFDNIEFFGRVTEEKKATLLAQSWAMLQPSQVEGWGITVIESNLMGTPVIASRVNGLKDSVIDGKTGILVQVRDVYQFSEAMKVIAKDTTYRNVLSHNAYVWARTFDWDKSARDFYQVFARSMESGAKWEPAKELSWSFSPEES